MVIMNNNLTVLKLFSDNKGMSFTIRKAAKELTMNYKIAYGEVLSLEKEGLLTVAKLGNAKMCSFRHVYNSKIAAVEEARKEEAFKNKDIKLIHSRLKENRSPYYTLILFGSYANKTNRKGSDIDLCVIADSPDVPKDMHAMLRITPLPVHLVEFTSEQFVHMLRSKETNVANEILKNSIILYGIEPFYELVSRVKQ